MTSNKRHKNNESISCEVVCTHPDVIRAYAHQLL
ncbi:MAG TPA: transcriptional repressor SmtB, partial [Desulfitobacterium dehalogenans]|nr:transcriptional repressor SmtB [Desulfitobacterium dehalogenans]